MRDSTLAGKADSSDPGPAPTGAPDAIGRALDWLAQGMGLRLRAHLGKASAQIEGYWNAGPVPSLWPEVLQRDVSGQEALILTLALVPHVRPELLGRLITEILPEGGDFPEFGGVRSGAHRGILPTGETAQFLFGGTDLGLRLGIQEALSSAGRLILDHQVALDPVQEGDPVMSGRLTLDAELVERVTLGRVGRPRFSSEFPAELLQTNMNWEDLVLHPGTAQQLQEIRHWIAHSQTLRSDWGMGRLLKPGYRALFFGPPGTGKTTAATLLGKQTGKDVFRIDLSRVVSKYIGETEKNLSRLFDRAEHKNWILFFDEADALFSRRMEGRDALERHGNQEVAYLLQRIESFDGVVILASNQRAHIDEAFLRRLHAMIHFPMPRAEERQAIWCKAMPAQLEVDVDWANVAARYELTGAAILNVTQYCAIEALAKGSHRVDMKLLEAGVLRELVKDGKIV